MLDDDEVPAPYTIERHDGYYVIFNSGRRISFLYYRYEDALACTVTLSKSRSTREWVFAAEV